MAPCALAHKTRTDSWSVDSGDLVEVVDYLVMMVNKLVALFMLVEYLGMKVHG